MANERNLSGPTLIEGVLNESLGGPRQWAFLATMQDAVPWEALAKPVRKLYRNGTGNCETANRRVDLSEFVRWARACSVEPVAAVKRYMKAAW